MNMLDNSYNCFCVRLLCAAVPRSCSQDVVEKAIEMPLSRMRWGDEEMGQLSP